MTNKKLAEAIREALPFTAVHVNSDLDRCFGVFEKLADILDPPNSLDEGGHKWNEPIVFRRRTMLRQCGLCGVVQIQSLHNDQRPVPENWKVIFRELGDLRPVVPNLLGD